ncbi:MAG TPA: hypothetical protein VFQ39_11505 [Longimicrobium sp.]|nr:hypothetical protein [Longimicrobium sp.]
MPAPVLFPDFVSSLADLGRVARENPALHASIITWVEELQAAGPPTRQGLIAFLGRNPDAVPVLATCVGLTQEMLKNQLRHRLGTSGWVTLARRDPERLVDALEEYGLLSRLTEQIERQWSFSDVLLERHLWSQRNASGAQGRGRGLEDQVEEVVVRLGLAAQTRTQFVGRRGMLAPCDLAIPAGGEAAQIVVAMKGFNSTGSKLTDAVREVMAMAEARLPQQFVFAVIDGIGWKSRQADLKRMYDLWERRSIDGLYTLAHLDRFAQDIGDACKRLGII